MTDVADAARRLAALARSHGERDGYPHMADLVALLPILDAVATGRDASLCKLADAQSDAAREHELAMSSGDREHEVLAAASYERARETVRAAMALADAERAAKGMTDA